MADQIEAELIVTAIAKGFDELSNAMTDQAKAFKEADDAARKNAEAAKAQQKAIADQEKAARQAEQAMKNWGEGAKMAFEMIGKGLDYAAKASERLGRTDMPDALESAEQAVQKLGDSLLELPIGKINPLFQMFGDEALKDADALTILAKGLGTVSDGANAVTAAWIKYQAKTGAITWEEAARQIDELTGAVKDNRTEAQKAAASVNAYAARWTAMAAEMKGRGDETTKSINRMLEMEKAEEAKAKMEELEKAAQLLAAGMSGALSNAQQSYTDTTAETSVEIEKLQKELDKYQALNGKTVTVTEEATVSATEAAIAQRDLGEAQKELADNTDPKKTLDLTLALEKAKEKADDAAKGLGGTSEVTLDYTKKIEDLNTKLDEQRKKQEEAALAVKEANAQFVFQQASASLDAEGQLALAFSLGLIDEKSYNASKRVLDLTAQFDANHDKVVDATEGQDDYINALNYVAQTADGTVAPMTDYKNSVLEAEAAMNAADGAAQDLTKSIGGIPDKTVTVTTQYLDLGTPGGRQSGAIGDGYASGGDFIVPPGYPNDSFPMRVQSGERVIVQTPAQQAQGGMGITIGNVTINAAPGQNGAALWDEFSAAAAQAARAQRATGAWN
jgi:hypothetical protein